MMLVGDSVIAGGLLRVGGHGLRLGRHAGQRQKGGCPGQSTRGKAGVPPCVHSHCVSPRLLIR